MHVRHTSLSLELERNEFLFVCDDFNSLHLVVGNCIFVMVSAEHGDDVQVQNLTGNVLSFLCVVHPIRLISLLSTRRTFNVANSVQLLNPICEMVLKIG